MQTSRSPIKIALADDHILLRNALAILINSFPDCQVVCEANNGRDLIAAITEGNVPDVLLLDQNMPEMDGLETSQWLYKHYPEINILMLSQYDSELSMIKFLQNGVKGFLKKDVEPKELQHAIESVMEKGFYYSKLISNKLLNLIRNNDFDETRIRKISLSDKEMSFLKYSATILSYKEIAEKMNLSPRAIELLRTDLFEKLEVQNRVGLVIIAMRQGFIA